MRTLTTTTLVLASVLVGAGASADTPPPKPPGPYPMQATVFRETIDKLVDQMRGACNRLATCPRSYVESGITQMKTRTLEVCRDGVVTKQESEWVLAAKPTIPRPPNPHPDDPE